MTDEDILFTIVFLIAYTAAILVGVAFACRY